MGFAWYFGYAELPQFTQPISRDGLAPAAPCSSSSAR
jgi:hypothetical protein